MILFFIYSAWFSSLGPVTRTLTLTQHIHERSADGLLHGVGGLDAQLQAESKHPVAKESKQEGSDHQKSLLVRQEVHLVGQVTMSITSVDDIHKPEQIQLFI